MNAIEINSLTKKYKNLIAVNNVSLTIPKGEIFGLLGPNGAGKTTLLMMLSTLLKPTSGTAWVNGFDILTQPAKVRSSIGMVFQDPSSDEVLTGYENLKLHALMYNVPVKEIDRKIHEVLRLVEMDKRQHDVVKKYSGGMRRRMEIARGLIHEPEILFLDEPTLGLDPQTRKHIWKYIENLAEQTGMTIVLTTHYMEEAENLCHRIAIIDHGNIIALDSPANLISRIGGDVVTLKGKELQAEKISHLPFVMKMQKTDDGLRLSVKEAGKNLQHLLGMAGTVDYVEVRSPDLNDVFLHYTGSAIREEEGDAMEYVRKITRARYQK